LSFAKKNGCRAPFLYVKIEVMENLNLLTGLLFTLVTGVTIYFFYSAVPAGMASRKFGIIVLCWIVLQSILTQSGFYLKTNSVPPRIFLLFVPPLFLILVMFLTVSGRNFMDSLDARKLTLLHIIRVPVEIVLYLLFLDKQVPQLMSFAGGNLDILSGLSAPVIYYLIFSSGKAGHRLLLTWNFICLGLLLWIVVRAAMSVPTPFQRLAFDQPNLAILHFPYSLLPCCIVPLVFFSHLAIIRRLTTGKATLTAIHS